MKLRHGKHYTSRQHIEEEKLQKETRRHTFHVVRSLKIRDDTSIKDSKLPETLHSNYDQQRQQSNRIMPSFPKENLKFDLNLKTKQIQATSTPYIQHSKQICESEFESLSFSRKTASYNKESASKTFVEDTANESRSRSLEENLFHDISLLRTSEYFSKGLNSDNKFYKLDQSFLSDVEFSDYDDEFKSNVISSVNHIKRSIFRQKRRDWYLRRYNYGNKKHTYRKSLFLHYIIKFIYTVITYFHLLSQFVYHVTYRVLVKYLYASLINIVGKFINISRIFENQFKKSKKENFISNESLSYWHSYQNVLWFDAAHLLRKGKSQLCNILLWCFVSVLLLPILLFPYFNKNTDVQEVSEAPVVPVYLSDPADFNLQNAISVVVNGTEKIPIWLVHPGETLTKTGPSILYLRLDGNHTEEKRLSVYRILSALGYHVIVPNLLLSQDQILSVWSWMKSFSQKSPMYLWGDEIKTSEMKNYAKNLCHNLIPPSGVIIEIPNKFTSLKHRSLEVWSCNCTSVFTEDGSSYHSYNHVKCPIDKTSANVSNDDFYNQLVLCIQAVHSKA